MHDAVTGRTALPLEAFTDPADGGEQLRRRPVPKPETKLPFLRDPRLRRSSAAGRFLAAACMEALGGEKPERFAEHGTRLAVIVSSYCVVVAHEAIVCQFLGFSSHSRR